MSVTGKISSLLWGEATIILIVALGIYHTIKSRFIQFRMFSLIGGKSGKNRMKAVTSALAASMGTGNITGCAAAIAAGGAGAVFWMWVSAFFGMALAFSENKLGADFARRFKRTGSPMLYMEKGLESPVLARVYAGGCLCAAFFIGSMSQSAAFAEALSDSFSAPQPVFSMILALITGFVIFSSHKASDSIMSHAEKLVPVMGFVFTLACAAQLIAVRADLPAALAQIISCAFSPEAAVGGAVGVTVKKAVSVGLRRGVFSNEAGMGSSVLVHSEADFGSPDAAGAWAAFEVFLDTMVCCTLTAAAVITSPLYREKGVFDVTRIFYDGLGSWGSAAVTLCICLFSWASVLGWCCYGEKCLDVLVRRRGAGTVFKLLFCLSVFLGGVIPQDSVLDLSDLFNALVMFINLGAITVLTACEKNYSSAYDQHFHGNTNDDGRTVGKVMIP